MPVRKASRVSMWQHGRLLCPHLTGIFFSKDRKEEVIEVIEEDPERVKINGQFLPIMSQGEWMKGCPEGGEQSFLFSLYNLLSSETCACPQGCGYSVQRKKSDFFAVYVRQPRARRT